MVDSITASNRSKVNTGIRANNADLNGANINITSRHGNINATNGAKVSTGINLNNTKFSRSSISTNNSGGSINAQNSSVSTGIDLGGGN